MHTASGRSTISQTGGANLLFGHMKMKEIGPRAVARPWRPPPLNSPLHCGIISFVKLVQLAEFDKTNFQGNTDYGLDKE